MVQVPSLTQFLIVMLAAWLAPHQEAFIEYLLIDRGAKYSGDWRKFIEQVKEL